MGRSALMYAHVVVGTQGNHLSAIDIPMHQYINRMGHGSVSYLFSTRKIPNDSSCLLELLADFEHLQFWRIKKKEERKD